jgi:hypothetical protein
MNSNEFYIKAKGLKYSVKRRLEDKLNEVPEKVRTFTQENCVLSGGCFSSLLHGEKINDYDLYLKDLSKTKELLDLLKEYVGPAPLEETPYTEAFVNGKIITANAITLSNRLQYIIRADFKSSKEMFDYVHCMVNYDIKEDKLWVSQEQLESIVDKKLKRNNAQSITVHREEKYRNKGWK